MKSVKTMATRLPDVYKSYRKFIDDSVFGEGEQEEVHPDEEEQREFTKKFYAEVEEEMTQQKGKERAEEKGAQGSADGSSSETQEGQN